MEVVYEALGRNGPDCNGAITAAIQELEKMMAENNFEGLEGKRISNRSEQFWKQNTNDPFLLQKISVCARLLIAHQKMILPIFSQVLSVFCKGLFNMISMDQLIVKLYVPL